MAQRSRSDYQIFGNPVTTYAYHTVCGDNAWHSNGALAAALNGSKKVMADYVTPRFNSRRAAGERFFSNMYKEEVTVSTVGTGYQLRSNANSCSSPAHKAEYRSDGPIVQVFIPAEAVNERGHYIPRISTALSDAEILAAQKRVSTEVLSKRGTGDSELWESLAEYRQTIELLRNPLTQLKDLSKRLLHNVDSGVFSRGLLKEVSAGYLLYRYGITPLMKDIRDILSSLHKEGGHKEVTQRAREQLTATSVITGTTTWDIFRANWSNLVDDVVTVRGMSLDQGYVSYANNLGLSFKGLAVLPLQLTSYSFVADWFTNLSSYVQATIPALGWKQLGSCLVTTRATSNAYQLTSVIGTNSNYTVTEAPTGSIGIVRLSTTRTPLLPASFEIKPDFRFDEFKRVADAAALVSSRFIKLNGLVGPLPNNSAFRDRKAYRDWAATLGHSRQFT